MGNISQALSIGKTGLSKRSGGNADYGIPDTPLFKASTTALTAGQVRYSQIRTFYSRILTEWIMGVTTGPASNANLRLGIYRADSEVQPAGAPLYDSGDISVASGFTGTKTATGLSIPFPAGNYLVALNCDVAMTLQIYYAAGYFVDAGLGSTPFVSRFTATQTYGALPTPGTAWTAVTLLGDPHQYFAFWRWTE